MATVDPATPERTHRLAALSALLGLPFLLGGVFLPLIMRINYLGHVGCPSSPQCPPPSTDAYSYWEHSVNSGSPFTLNWAISMLVGLGPLLALLVAQAAIARSAWRGRTSRPLLNRGVLASLVGMAVFLYVCYGWYCFFFCDLEQGFPVPGELYSVAGMWTAPGVRYLAPGFWLMLSGLLLIVVSDLTMLVGARQSARQPH